jgi:hypothetical protein
MTEPETQTESAQQSECEPGVNSYHRTGFPEFPEPLWGVEEVTVRCDAPDEFCEWAETYEIDPADIKLNGAGLLEFDFDEQPLDCPECGNPYTFEYNEVNISRDLV